jgi:hypothetical protein
MEEHQLSENNSRRRDCRGRNEACYNYILKVVMTWFWYIV